MIEWKKDIIEEIVECYNLKEGWDGDGATAPNHKSLDDAFAFIKLLPDDTRAAVGCMHLYGRYGIGWYKGITDDFHLDIEFLGDGKLVFYMEHNGNKGKGTIDMRFAQKLIKQGI